MAILCGTRLPLEVRMQCTGGCSSGRSNSSGNRGEQVIKSVLEGKKISSSRSSIDTRQTHWTPASQHSIKQHLSASDSTAAAAADAATTTSERSKTLIGSSLSLSAISFQRHPTIGVMLVLVAIQLLLSASSSSATPAASASNTINEVQQNLASSRPQAAIPKYIHSSSTSASSFSSSSSPIFNSNSEQLHAARSPLSITARRLKLEDATGGGHGNGFLVVGRWQGDVIGNRRIGRSAPLTGHQVLEDGPTRNAGGGGSAKVAGGYIVAGEEPSCRQLTAAWRALKLYYPNLMDHLLTAFFSNSAGTRHSHMNIGKILALIDKSLASTNAQSSMQRSKSANSALIAKVVSNPFYYNIFRRYMDNLNTAPVLNPEYLNRIDSSAEELTHKAIDKDAIYGRIIKHPNEWSNNQIARTNEKLHYLKLLSKQYEPDQQEQQLSHEPQLQESAESQTATDMPIYGRVVSNPIDSSPDSLLNRRRITSENLEKLRKMAASEFGAHE